MPTLRLIKSEIDKLPGVDKLTYFNDPDVPGFWLRQTPTGARAWGVDFRVGSGRRATKGRITIASFGKLTPDQARREAKRLIAEAALGTDPAAKKAERKQLLTMAELVDLYEAEGCYVQRGKRQGQPMKPLTKKYTVSRIRHHVVPLLGRLKAKELSVTDVERFFRAVEAGETASDTKKGPRCRVTVTGGNGAARKVFGDLSAMCSFAVRREIMTENPCFKANVQRTGPTKERFLSIDEIERLVAAVETLVEAGANPKALKIILLWLFTGARRNEIAGLKWSEVRLNASKPELQLEDSKTGKSWRPMVDEVFQILQSTEREPDSEYVFPAERGASFYQGVQGVWEKAIKATGLEDVTPHTLRHTMGSHAVSVGLSLPLTGAILGHTNPRSTQRYAHIQRDPVQEAATRAVAAFAHVGRRVHDLTAPKPRLEGEQSPVERKRK
ncbi:site-specific integrase [Caulobacter sp. S45]|uniref:site-specific integrase n=1 Tax=Caulobacter sp. S45 TaxID=1641861 RepID=UPI001575A702|nr:site-specific integrase [Caulobacter sp. S45]